MGEKAARTEREDRAKVNAIREAVKLDLVQMYKALSSQINGMQESSNTTTLTNTHKVLNSEEPEEPKATALDLANKVSKVTIATDKIASETTTGTFG